MYIMLLFQCFMIIFDQRNGIKLKHNGVNVKHNRYSLLKFLNSVIGKKNFSITWTALRVNACNDFVRSILNVTSRKLKNRFAGGAVRGDSCVAGELSIVKAWVGLTAAKIACAVRVCTRHRMLCNCGLLNTATLMFTFA